MRAIYGPTTGGAWLLTAVLVTSACRSEPATPRSAGLDRQLQELSLGAERDSLLMEVAANARLLADLEAELRTTAPKPQPGQPESPALEVTKDTRTIVLERVRALTTRLKTAETQLAQSERRARRLTRAVDSLGTGLTGAKGTITDLVEIVGQQREQVTALTTQVDELTTVALTLDDSVRHLTDDRNTAYFVVGTREELLRKGVLVEDGHRAIPLVGRRGVSPARELPLGEFTSIDRAAIHEIPLPRVGHKYRIVSRQNLAHLTSWVGQRSTVKDRIAIGDADRFWEPSRYLIVVEQ